MPEDAALYTFMLSERWTQDDGGASRVTLNQLKQGFMADVDNLRAGVESKLSGQQWCVKVIEDFLHKKRIDTVGEVAKLTEVIFEQKMYDLATGEKKKKDVEDLVA